MKKISLLGCFMFILYILLGVGYILNIYKFVKCDFKAPYKEEIVRGVGIVIPYGSVIGYIHIDDSK